jgi:murein DD-endopeptidase MepM/ murein hydrolase activator NlpD
LQAQKAVAEDQLSDWQRLLSETKSREDSYKKIVSDLEKQQQDISEEIGDIENQLRSQYGSSTVPSKRPGVFGKPTSGILTQKYGTTPYSRKLYRNGFHNGVDYGVPVGTPILAAEDGVAQMVGNNGKLQYGRYILIRHNNGLSTIYAHLSRQIVKTGDEVKRGDIIGYSGNTGYAFGPHLHFGAYLSSTVKLQQVSGAGLVPVGYTLDPLDYL